MARAQNTDFLHLMRFTVAVVQTGQPNLISPADAAAGFTSVTLPNYTVTMDPYKEGQMIYPQKYPGNPSVSQVTLSRGVARLDSSFWDWMRVVTEGSGEYRADLNVNHYHRDTALLRQYPVPQPSGSGIANTTTINTDHPARIYHLFEAFPTTFDIATSALDGSADSVAIQQIILDIEHFEIEEVAAP